MANLFDAVEPSLDDQLAEVRREIGFRERLYPGWIRDGRMSQLKADVQLRDMRAVAKTIERLRNPKPPGR